MGNWIRTFTGRAVNPALPVAAEIDIQDIAHALSMLCRWGGHTSRFYSVAEHSVHVSRHCPPELRLWGLLHDATEAYLVDMPRPLKPLFAEYKTIEDGMMAVIAEKFELEPAAHMPPAVKEIDNRILLDERDQLMKGCVQDIGLGMAPLGVDIRCWSPELAEMQFLDAFDRLTQQ